MKQLYTLPEHYLRYLLEANAEDAQLKPYRSTGPCWPRALWQRSCSVQGAQHLPDEGAKRINTIATRWRMILICAAFCLNWQCPSDFSC